GVLGRGYTGPTGPSDRALLREPRREPLRVEGLLEGPDRGGHLGRPVERRQVARPGELERAHPREAVEEVVLRSAEDEVAVAVDHEDGAAVGLQQGPEPAACEPR